MRAVALRYALAPACVLLAVLVFLSPARPALSLAGLFVFAVLAAAWFGGAGPGFLAAVLATFTLPHLIAVGYPLLGGFFDVPRFITFSLAGLAVGGWSFRRRRVEAALRLSEERHARAMEGSDAGHWDWNMVTDEMFVSERAREMLALPTGTLPTSRTEIMELVPQHPDDRAGMNEKVQAGIRAGIHVREYRVIPQAGSVRWLRSRGKVYKDAGGAAIRMTGSLTDITESREALEKLRNSEQRYALAMEAAGDGHTDWDLVSGEFYISPRLLEIVGHAPGASFADRADWVRRFPFHPEDRPKWEAAIAAHFAGRESHFKMEVRIVVHGEVRWTSFHFLSMRDAAGTPIRWTGSIGDITERKRVEEALRASDERYSLAMEASEEGYVDSDIDTDQFVTSERLNEIFGIPRGTRFADRSDFLKHFRFYGDDAKTYADMIRAVGAPGGTDRYEFEFRIVLRSGQVRWLWTRGKVTRDAAGRARRRIGVLADITDAKLAGEELRESEARFRALTELSSDWYWEQDENLRFTYLSNQAAHLTGYSGESSLGKTRWEIVNMTPLMCSWAEHQVVLAARQPFRDLECRRVGPDGTVRYLSMSGAPIFDAQGRFRGYRGIGRNITARKLAEQALHESEARKSAMFETALDCIITIDDGGRVVEFNPAAERTFGYRRAEALGKELAELIVPPRLRAQHRQGLARYLKGGEARVLGRRTEMAAVRADGSEFLVELSVTRIATEGAPLFTAYLRDITERKRIEEALRQSEERYALAVAGSNEGIFDWDLINDRVYVSRRAQELFGLPPGDLWRPRRDWRHILNFHPDDAPRLHDSIKAHIEGVRPTYDEEFRIVMSGGAVRWFRQRGVALRDASGKAYRVVGSIGEVTEKHKAAEDLGSLERKLRLAQRLEAMGTLAGGIAHDFNNILGAILGYGEMALRGVPKASRLARDLDSIMIAGERGRALVDRVLAFSRSAVGERVPVHVERVVREALDLTSANLPPSVTVQARLRAGVAAVLGDATQVHQVVANLATNAVQAMTAGGTLRVQLANERVDAPRAMTIGGLGAGEYVVLTVADTGGGIAPEIVERIFDPFFTTKEVGTGTGLGLSLVHGIVSDLGGAIDVASTLGTGSTFTVYLPRSGDAVQPIEEKESALPRGTGQRVLIVDDEEPLVQLATRALVDLGYVPTGFTSSAAALEAFRADPERFDALITDERMPEMSGATLIREVRGMRSAMPVVLMSGYLGATEGKADEVLQKPLSARDLAASLARVLHLQPPSRRASLRSSKRRPARSPSR
jgi:PAS domain S-box-containing protein